MRSASQLARRSSVLPRRMSTPVQQSGDFDELRERSLLRHVIAKSTEGDAASVLSAMDTFWDTYFNGEGTAEWQVRSSALDAAVRAKQPTVAMEIGAYCGYTAVRMGALMPAGGKLISVELDPLYAAIATKVRSWPPPFPAPPCDSLGAASARSRTGKSAACALRLPYLRRPARPLSSPLRADGGARRSERPRAR